MISLRDKCERNLIGKTEKEIKEFQESLEKTQRELFERQEKARHQMLKGRQERAEKELYNPPIYKTYSKAYN